MFVKKWKDFFIVEVRPSPEQAQILRCFPGYAKWKNGSLLVANTGANIDHLLDNFSEIAIFDVESQQTINEYKKQKKEAAKTAEIKHSDDIDYTVDDYTFKNKPYDHQLKAFKLSRDIEKYAILAEQGCVDCDTEVLTENGWVKISNYKSGKVMQWCPDSFESTFVYPDGLLISDCKEMLHFKNVRSLDQMLSPGHTIPVIINGYYKNKKVTDISALQFADEVNSTEGKKHIHTKMPATFINVSTDLPGICKHFGITEQELRLQIAVMADGYYPSIRSHRCLVRLKKQRKKDRLRNLLIQSNTKFTEKPCKPDGFTVFTFKTKIITKTYSIEFWKSNLNELKIICDEVKHWDSSTKENGSVQFFSSKKQDVDFIQYAYCSIGRMASVSCYDRTNDKKRNRKKEYAVFVSIESKKTNAIAKNRVETVKTKDGKMYCLKVPSGYMIYRRNGKVFPSGNTGKTKVAIDTARYLYDKGDIDCCVIIAPNNVHRNWILKEIPEHCPGDFSCAHYSSTMSKKEKTELEKTISSDKMPFIAYNFDGFSRKSKQRLHFENLLKSKRCMVIIDESSRIKNPSSKRTKYLIKECKNVKYKRIMSGTPITKGMEDLYSQFTFLDTKILGYNSFYTFRNHFCRMGGFENRQIIGYMNVDELVNKIDSYSFRVLKEECLDLPEKIFKQWKYDLSPKQRQLYDTLAKQYLAELDGVEIAANLGIVRALRLHQIACGWFGTDEEWSDNREIDDDNPRLECLKEVLLECEDSPGKTIIWAKFQKDLDEIEKLLGCDAVSLHGRVSNDNKMEAIRRFQNDDSVKYLIGNPRSGGIGITLTAADNAIYYSYDEDLDVMLQSLDRNHRIDKIRNEGRKCVVYHFIQARNTVDDKFAKTLKYKKGLADIVTQDPKAAFLGES